MSRKKKRTTSAKILVILVACIAFAYGVAMEGGVSRKKDELQKQPVTEQKGNANHNDQREEAVALHNTSEQEKTAAASQFQATEPSDTAPVPASEDREPVVAVAEPAVQPHKPLVRGGAMEEGTSQDKDELQRQQETDQKGDANHNPPREEAAAPHNTSEQGENVATFQFQAIESSDTAPVPTSEDREPVVAVAEPSVHHYKPLHCSNGIYSLSEAARAGKVKLVRTRLKEGYPVNLRNEQGMTPLHLAAQAGHKEVAELLISQGADAMARDKQDRTPLDLAQGEEMKALLNHACTARKEEMALFDQIGQDGTSELRAALKHGMRADVYDKSGLTPILIAATTAKNKEAVELLLKAGATVGLTGNERKTALHVAAGVGATEIALLLLKAGADPMAEAGNGSTALHEAVWFYHPDTLRALLPYYKKKNYSPSGGWVGTPAGMAINTGKADLLQIMLDAGMKVNDACFAEPLLVLAAKKNNVSMIKMLLKAGARKDTKDQQGKMAVDYASGEARQLLK